MPQPRPSHPWRRPAVIAGVGVACLVAAVLVWPSADLADRLEQARAQAIAARDALSEQEQVRRAAEQSREESIAARDAALERLDTIDAEREELALAEEVVQDAEDTVLEALSESFTAADAVVAAQNDAVARGNAGDSLGEQAVIAAEAVPAVREYRQALAAADAGLADVGSSVAGLLEVLP